MVSTPLKKVMQETIPLVQEILELDMVPLVWTLVEMKQMVLF
jgi:hypothetical protein